MTRFIPSMPFIVLTVPDVDYRNADAYLDESCELDDSKLVTQEIVVASLFCLNIPPLRK